MKHKIDPTIDCVFKAILGKVDNTNLLIHFLNAILVDKYKKNIVTVKIENPFNEREFQTDKLNIVDIKAKDESGKIYQIEVQLNNYEWLPARILYNWCTTYKAQLKKGAYYDVLKPVISIWILKRNIFLDTTNFHLNFNLYDNKEKFYLTDHLDLHLLQLPKYKLQRNTPSQKDIWLYFFKEGKNMDINKLPKSFKTPEMVQAIGVLEDFSENERNYSLYQKRLEAERIESTLKAGLARALKEKEKERLEKEKERQEKEKERQEKNKERLEKETIKKKLKRAYELLNKAGVDIDNIKE